MPYLNNGRKAEIHSKSDLPKLLSGLEEIDLVAGDLNYIFTRIALTYLKKKNYSRINDVIGAFECAKLELYRRFVAIYEDVKKQENGDVF